MHILEEYVAGLNSGDQDKVAALFAEDCKFSDGGARTIDIDDLVADGREALRAAFGGVFGAYKVKAEIVKLNDHSMEYDVYLGDGDPLPCIGCATCNSDGLIEEYIVRPR